MVKKHWKVGILLSVLLVVTLVTITAGPKNRVQDPLAKETLGAMDLQSHDYPLQEFLLQKDKGGKGALDENTTYQTYAEWFKDALWNELKREEDIDSATIYSFLRIEEKVGFRDDFHSYSQMTNELQNITAMYPGITNLYNLGTSVQGRTIWGLKITDYPDLEENEPEVRIAGLHHGNELMSVELPLLLAWHLVENYTLDGYISGLVNATEIWIIPMVNPDGREATPPTRRNANNVDLNRDYGYMWNGEGNSPAPFSQPETQIIRDHALDNNFVLSLSFHTSGDIVNYVWNYKPHPTPDDPMVANLSTLYGSYNGYWVVRGYNWYQTRGDTNDFSYGCRGDIDWTIEVQNTNIPQAWGYNKEGMLEIIDAADQGLTGVVTDNATGQPLNATIWVEEVYWPCFTDPKIGDYHRLLSPGNYTVHFQANGYQEKILNAAVANGNEATILNVTLDRGNNYFAYQVCWCNFYDPYSYPNNFQNNPTEAISALGPPDNISASLGVGGEIVLDMGYTGQLFNGPGVDFTIFEGDDTPEGYTVFASSIWNGPWIQIGSGYGTNSFDLDAANMTHARFIKIQDDGDGSPFEINPGFDLDALQAINTFDIYIDGIDVSASEGIINWSTVYQSGYRFAFAKATEGVEYTDTYFQDNMENGSNAGLFMGTYHYATPQQDDAIAEAEYFLQWARNFITHGYLRPVLKLETGSEMGTTLLSNWVHDWMGKIENETGVQPLLYVSSTYANQYLDTSVNQYDLWIANWTDDLSISPDIGIWDDWIFWQYRNHGSVPGVTGYVDMDVFKGNLSKLNDFVITVQYSSKPLYKGWNLITIPLSLGWTAATLGNTIDHCTVVCRFNASTQTYTTHVVGIPYNEFPIQDGVGYFVYVTTNSSLNVTGYPLESVSVPIKTAWNLIGWYHEYATTAGSLGGNITNCTVVCNFNASTQSYTTHVVGIPYNDFVVERGEGLFIYTTVESIWQGEG